MSLGGSSADGAARLKAPKSFNAGTSRRRRQAPAPGRVPGLEPPSPGTTGLELGGTHQVCGGTVQKHTARASVHTLQPLAPSLLWALGQERPGRSWWRGVLWPSPAQLPRADLPWFKRFAWKEMTSPGTSPSLGSGKLAGAAGFHLDSREVQVQEGEW